MHYWIFRLFPVFSTWENPILLKCEVILLRNEMRGEITKYCLYQTLSMYLIGIIFNLKTLLKLKFEEGETTSAFYAFVVSV